MKYIYRTPGGRILGTYDGAPGSINVTPPIQVPPGLQQAVRFIKLDRTGERTLCIVKPLDATALDALPEDTLLRLRRQVQDRQVQNRQVQDRQSTYDLVTADEITGQINPSAMANPETAHARNA